MAVFCNGLHNICMQIILLRPSDAFLRSDSMNSLTFVNILHVLQNRPARISSALHLQLILSILSESKFTGLRFSSSLLLDSRSFPTSLANRFFFFLSFSQCVLVIHSGLVGGLRSSSIISSIISPLLIICRFCFLHLSK
jgi:hypothetical protein